eukprot:3491017-Rhodomonas_salina.2
MVETCLCLCTGSSTGCGNTDSCSAASVAGVGDMHAALDACSATASTWFTPSRRAFLPLPCGAALPLAFACVFPFPVLVPLLVPSVAKSGS